MTRIDSCAYQVYVRVLERVRWVRAHGRPGELQTLAANLDALAGAARLAAGLAKVDAEAERPARAANVVCRCVCDRFECEEHPHRR